MKATILVLLLALLGSAAGAQNWTGYPAASIGLPYINGVMTATVTKVNTTMNSGTPMYTTSTSPDCYIAAGCLALNAGFFNSYIANSSRIQVDLDFTTGGTNGTCNSATWTMRDINSGESFTDFLDVVEISGIDGNNNPIAPGSIVVTPPVQVSVTTVASSKKIVGHNSLSEVVTGGPYSSTPCNLTSVTVTPPANVTLKSIRIIYRPAVGTSSANAYYSVGTHPAVQYISISNLTLTPTGGGCSVLAAQLEAFDAKEEAEGNLLTWKTTPDFATSHFLLERSEDAIHYEALNLQGLQSNSDGPNAFTIWDPAPFPMTYYRLSSVDANGQNALLGTISAANAQLQNHLLTLSPNPSQGKCSLQTLSDGRNVIRLSDLSGKEIWEGVVDGVQALSVNWGAFPDGIYLLSIQNGGRSQHQKCILGR